MAKTELFLANINIILSVSEIIYFICVPTYLACNSI